MSKKKIIIIIILVLVILIGIIYIINRNSNDLAVNNLLEHDEAEDLYEAVATSKCSNININNKVSTQEMNDEVLLYLIFGQMKKDNVLKDSISLNDYSKSAKKIIGDVNIPEKIENYVYDNYIYNLENNEITREKYNCGNKKYVSKLYGYSTSENQIQLDVSAGYIQDNKIYNLDGKLIGDYDKENLDKTLDNGTMEVYIYTKKNNNYILDSISLK